MDLPGHKYFWHIWSIGRQREIAREKAGIRRLPWEKTERQCQALEQQRDDEERRRSDLLLQTDGWATAERIRSIVAATDARIDAVHAARAGRPQTHVPRRAWALGVADEIAPIEKLATANQDSLK